MKQFKCSECGQFVFFENSACVNCGKQLAYLPDDGLMHAFSWEQFAAESPGTSPPATEWRPCANFRTHEICNWAVATADENPLCRSCRLTHVIPTLSESDNLTAWLRLETAKRRLIFGLMSLGMTPVSKTENPANGLAFEFLEDTDGAPVLTGHHSGLITINLAEADDVERERRRLALHEPYRTLLGHFRHESGHYIWDQWIRDSDRLEDFRKVFGDERRDYAAALAQHYEQGPAADWQANYISAYSGSHPWEDWAETWAHYLHMRDGLEIAGWSGLQLTAIDSTIAASQNSSPTANHPPDFDRMLSNWFSLTYIINNLNRGLGLADGYPFVLSPPVIAKLRFVHSIVETFSGSATATPPIIPEIGTTPVPPPQGERKSSPVPADL